MLQTILMRMVPRGRVRPWWGQVAVLLGLALSLGCVTRSQAATTWTVCASGCDYRSIKAAIAAPTTLDGDTLAFAAGTYTEPGILVSKSLTLQGEDADTTIVQAAPTPGTAPDRVFTIPSGVTVTFQDLTIRHGYVRKNPGWAFGGGLYNEGMVTLIRTIVRDNAAVDGSSGTAWGGGLFNTNGGTLTLIDSAIRNNSANIGSGFINYRQGSTLTIMNSTISDNAATHLGVVTNNYGTLTLINSTISGNKAIGFGNNNYGKVMLTNSTISGNAGGGIENYGKLALTNMTITDNQGRGLFNSSNAPGLATLTNVTISNNKGGGLANSVGTVTLIASIVANNPGGSDCVNFGTLPQGSIISHGYNLDSDGSCQLTTPTDLPHTDPLLGLLQDNGGPTLTQALLPGSPAIDAIPWGANGCGTTVIGDQRWQARPQPPGGHCDIGAYEVTVPGQALSAWVTGLTPHTAVCENVTTGQAVTLDDPATPWDCEAAGLGVSAGDQVVLRVRGPVTRGAPDVGGTVAGLAPQSGGCTNHTTGQQVKFQALFQGMRGATAASCGAAGLVVQPEDEVQMRVRGAAE